MAIDNQEDIEELIQLKQRKEANQTLNEEEERRLIKLALANKAFMALSAEDMQTKLQEAISNPDLDVVAQYESEEHGPEIVDLYNLKFKEKPWYQPPVVDSAKSTITLKFPSVEDETKFDREMAENNLRFKVIDKQTNTVVAYSSGDGVLYHGDGTEFYQETPILLVQLMQMNLNCLQNQVLVWSRSFPL
jgi:hypothetical protein